MTIEELFEKHQDEFLQYERDYSLKDKAKDVTLFNMLSDKIPPHKDLIIGAWYEEIFFDVDLDDFVTFFSEEEIVRMIRCGLRYDSERECLCMFV